MQQAFQDYQQRLNDFVNADSAPERAPLESLPNYDATCMKEGYLQKKGQRLKGWKRRWFVCDGRTISYYTHRKDRKPNAVMPLEGCTVQDGGISETWNSPRIYLTDCTSGIMYCLSAEEGTVVTEWLNVLRNAVAKATSADPSGHHKSGATAAGGSSAPRGDHSRAGALKGTNSFDSDAPVRTANGEKRMQRMMSGISGTMGHNVLAKPSHGSVNRLSTTVKLENNLSKSLETLESLLYNRVSPRNPVAFRPVGTSNGVLMALGENELTGSLYARGSVVIPVSCDVVAHLLTEASKRSEWDMHFQKEMHVATFGEDTDLIHLSGSFKHSVGLLGRYPSPQYPAVLCALLGAFLSPSWEMMIVNAAAAGIVGFFLASLDFSGFVAPRDLLLLRHLRSSSFSDKKSPPSCSDILDVDGDEMIANQSIVMILEKSIVNELKPPVSGVVRAHVDMSGWLLEPIDLGRTLVTHVTDIDIGGWMSNATKKSFVLKRLQCLDVLVELANQSKALGLDLIIANDQDSVDGDGHDEVEDVDMYGDDSSAEFHPSKYMRDMLQIPTGGLKLIDKEIAKKQSGVVKEILKTMGSKILEGKSVVSLSLPVRIFEPRSMLERYIDLFLYAPTFLNTAADQTDPVERMKYVVAFAVAGMHHGVSQMKPFNPILGETYQTVLNDGTEVCCEHTSHHPPISNILLVGKKYTISGYFILGGSMSIKSNALIQNFKGPIRVTFEDGVTITYSLPTAQLGGILWGDRTVDFTGSMTFDDRKNKLSFELKLNPDEKKGMGGMFSTPKTPSDHFRGAMVNTATGAEICDASGSWLEVLRFGEKPYWTLGREKSGKTIRLPDSKVLQSDVRYREDLQYLAMNNLDMAQEWKVKLEVLQRADRKIRLEGRKPNHWTFKDGYQGH